MLQPNYVLQSHVTHTDSFHTITHCVSNICRLNVCHRHLATPQVFDAAYQVFDQSNLYFCILFVVFYLMLINEML